jgi:4-amino-4-deoxy-L-arabinose transferase-like glycosyltransferase
MFPWTVLVGAIAVAVGTWLRRRDPWVMGFVFCLCWVGVWAVAFGVPRTKLPSYMTPVFPAAAMLVGAYLSRWVRGGAFKGEIEPKPVFGLLLACGAVAAVALLGFGDRLMPGVRAAGLVGLPVVVGAAVCLWLALRGNRPAAALALGATASAFAVAALAGGAHGVSRAQENQKLLDAITAAAPVPQVASYGRLEPTWVYYLGRTIREIPQEGPADAAAHLQAPDAFLITTADRAAKLAPSLPADVTTLEQVPYFGRRDHDLVVLGRGRPRPEVASAAAPAPAAQ